MQHYIVILGVLLIVFLGAIFSNGDRGDPVRILTTDKAEPRGFLARLANGPTQFVAGFLAGFFAWPIRIIRLAFKKESEG